MITQEDVDAVASPPLTEEQLARLKPAREFLSEERRQRLKAASAGPEGGNIVAFTTFEGSSQSVRDLSGEMAVRIRALIYEYSGRLPVVAAIGVLEVVKLEIFEEARDSD